MAVSDEQLGRWATGPSETENDKCENAVNAIISALRSHFGDRLLFIRQGSHRNRTNIRHDSDIDLAVVHKDHYFPDVSNLSEADKAHYHRTSTDSVYKFHQFKSDVHSILQREFGVAERKNKCIRIPGNTYRVNADVVPAYKHKRYRSYGVVSVEGIGFTTDDGNTHHSFPEHHYENGVAKNDRTSRSFKSVVRIIKNIRNELPDKSMPSFFIESLVWNAPDDLFSGPRWRDHVSAVSAKIWNDMRDFNKSNNYAEVSDLHWLFRGNTKRTPKQAEDFMYKVWHYVQ